MLDSINKAFETLKFISETRNISTSLVIDPCQSKFFENVYGDSNRYQQILLNFISNSLKFSNHGGKVTITLEV